jgi:hypothetical protein
MIPTSCLTYTQAWLHLIAFGKNSISDFKQKKLQKQKPSLPLKTRSIGIRVIALEFLVPYLISFSKVFLQI